MKGGAFRRVRPAAQAVWYDFLRPYRIVAARGAMFCRADPLCVRCCLMGVTVSNFDKRPFATVAELPLFSSEDSSSWDDDE